MHVQGEVDPQTGWVRDFADVRLAMEPLRLRLDHNYLNEIEGLENPTSEHIARWIWHRLAGELPGLCCIVVHETCNARCMYTGPG